MGVAADKRKECILLKKEMEAALSKEGDRRKRKQLQKDYEDGVAAIMGKGESEEIDDSPDIDVASFKMQAKEISKSEAKKERKAASRKAELESLKESFAAGDKSVTEAQEMDLEGGVVVSVAAEGNCLFRSLEHQRQRYPDSLAPMTFREIRKDAARYLRENRDAYIAFMDETVWEENGFEVYCDRLENTNNFAGEVEIKALSDGWQVPIKVYKTGKAITYNEELVKEGRPLLTISYHRHLLAEGHYNSVVPRGGGEEEKDDNQEVSP